MSNGRMEEPPKWRTTEPKTLLQMALKDGLLVGVCFVVQAVSLLLYRLGIIATLLLLVGMVGVPVLLYKLGKRYRDNYKGGYVRYLEMTNYLSWTFLASLVVAFLAFYISLSMLLNDATFIGMMEESIAIFKELTKESGTYKQALEAMRGITPLQVVWSLVLNIFVQGFIYIYIVSIFIKRSPKL